VDEEGADEVYNCSGLWIAPGLVDINVHLREPGHERRETIKTGTQAAAAGGFTTICCMPNTNPALDSPSLIDFIFDTAASPEAGGVFVAPVGAMTAGQKGERISDLAALKQAGICAASDEGSPVQDSGVLKRAMEFCLQLDLPLMLHCSDLALENHGDMNDGAMSAMLGLKGIPRSAEEIMIMRACILALNTGCPIHILRISTWGSVEIIRQFKHMGAPITCDATPHHLTLTEDDVDEYKTNFKTLPPLRTTVDLDILIEALNDGTIDCIASDHSPFASHEVTTPFADAQMGVVGLESSVGVVLTRATHQGVLSPLETIRRMSTAPAEILGLEAGTLKPGGTPVAQITVIDPNAEWKFDVNRTFSKGKNSPFEGKELQGKAVLTFVGSEIYRDAMFDSERHASTM
jgi:dihydroorotase